MRFKRNSLVVFEGLDKTGKSTQVKMLGERLIEGNSDPSDGEALFLHMPSGAEAISVEMYQIMEKYSGIDMLARQLMHLACHAQNMDMMHAAYDEGMLVLDRWWWSTVAYGLFGGELDVKLPPHFFMQTISMVWSGLTADIVFLFKHRYAEDDHNNDGVLKGYEQLELQNPNTVRVVPEGTPEEVHTFIMEELRKAELCI